MINKERIVNEFIEFVSIESVSKAERAFADLMIKKLKSLDIEFYEDNAGKKIGGNTGNIICTIKGNKKGKIPVIFSAHMDTVVPAKNKNIIVDGDIIKTDGTTILGADDVAGIVAILEAVRYLKEENIEHGDIQIIFSIAEEIGLLGAKNLEYAKIFGKMAFVLDNTGEIGHVAVKAPAQNVIDINISGKSAHAGMNPENGIDAIRIAAEAINNAELGRIDYETTANVGIISGGKATNIICDKVYVKAEVRSINMEKLKIKTEGLIKCFEESAKKFGGSIKYKNEIEYPSFEINEDSKIIDILKKSSKAIGLALELESTGGGSDTNIFNSKGIEAVDLSIAMENPHGMNEQVKISNLIKSAEFVVSIIKNI